MNGVLGGFKNMLLRWRINLKNKKKKRKYKLTSFIYSMIAVFIMPIGTILEENTVQKEYKKTINLKANKEDKKVKNKISGTKKTQLEKHKNIFLNPATKLIKTEPILKCNSKVISKHNYKPMLNRTIKKELGYVISKEKIEIIEEDLNKKIDELKEKIINISNKISQTTKYNDLFLYEKELKDLLKENKVIQVIVKNNVKLSKYIEKTTEIFELIDETYKNISLKKDELYFGKSKKQIKEEKSKEEQKKELVKSQKILYEVMKAKKLILDDIMKQNKIVENYLKQTNKVSNRKNLMMTYLNFTSINLLNLSMVLLPVNLFQNRLLGNYVSAVMINNSIKTMRKIINPALSINYEYFINNYRSNKNLIIDFNNLCDESIEQLEKLKYDIILFGNHDLINELETIKENILKQKESIKSKNDMLDRVYVKINCFRKG